MNKHQLLVTVIVAAIVFTILLWSNRERQPKPCPKCGGRVEREESYHKDQCTECYYIVSRW